MSDENKGLLIALAGISGCGKSTCAKKIREITSWDIFTEPEATAWGNELAANKEPSTLGVFTGFRNLRVPSLYEADHRRIQGRVALVDSYFDKVTGAYIQNDGMEWLLPKNDPYRDEIISIAHKDYIHLPLADVVVMFNVPQDLWKERMLARGRSVDQVLVDNNYYLMQNSIRSALQTLGGETGCRILDYPQRYKDVAQVAEDVLNLIAETPTAPRLKAMLSRRTPAP